MTSRMTSGTTSRTTRLHLHDHGGEGTPLLLLHGAGRSHADWAAAAPALRAAGHRVLAVDLPGHGRSPDRSPWTFDGVVADLAETLRAYGAEGAVPVGHSLGGMLAARYAVAHPGATPAAVSLDGFGWGTPGRHPDAERVRELSRVAAGAVAPAGHPERQAAYAEGFGIPRERAEAAAREAARPLPDGTWQTLPERAAALEMLDAMDTLDVFALLARVDCPLLLIRAERPQPPVPGMEWFDALMESWNRGLDTDLAHLTRSRPDSVTVTGVDATHAMLLEEPEAVATAVTDFLATATATATTTVTAAATATAALGGRGPTRR
ncbi:alpha/beta hydrolase [Streptomyces sp. NPDC000594]|uniref:alpha/beta fold hydrolase n=1 Tax=Streptomyces sp. NPDC000594 TaxID=3154261 RepID=UPI0033274D73